MDTISQYPHAEAHSTSSSQPSCSSTTTTTANMPTPTQHLTLDPSSPLPPTRDAPSSTAPTPPLAHASKLHPTQPAATTDASLYFVGTATTILAWRGLRLMTDPNFLHAGDHVHLGPGVTGTRQTNPALDLHALPRIDMVLLSHYHADHFDAEVEGSLRRDLPIVTTPHARQCLVDAKPEPERFTHVTALDTWQTGIVHVKEGSSSADDTKGPAIRVTAMPGEHVPPGPLKVANDLLGAVPPTNGWMVELGEAAGASSDAFKSGYRIYISGDTLMVDALKGIPEWLKGKGVDLMLVHLGGTSIPSAKAPLLMVTMDAKQGVELIRLIKPDVTVPVHFDDYDVFVSPLEDFKKEVEKAGLSAGVVYLDRGDEYKFQVGEGKEEV
jgi:L-ascorbate metabolism protein UlaG (beta-lactamase superfamily)